MKIAICDDFIRDAKALHAIIAKYPGISADNIRIYTDSLQLLSDFQTGADRCPLLFLDIDMPGMDGITLGKQIKSIAPGTIIVFTTVHPQYAIDAYDCEAFHYVLKPCNEEKVLEILTKAIGKYHANHASIQVKYRNLPHNLLIDDIYYIECCKKHIVYHLANETVETVDTLSNVYGKIIQYGFYQVHQGYIVNFAKVYEFKEHTIVLDNRKEVMISVRKKKDVLMAYAQYVENNL